MAAPAELLAVLRAKDESREGFENFRHSAESVEKGLGGISPAAIAAGAALAGAVAAAAALGHELFEVGAMFDAASDRIRASTGAVGDDLAGLKKDFESVFVNVAGVGADQVAATIADLHQRLGLTGEDLRTLATAEIELSKITNTDLNEGLRSSSQLFKSWQIDAESQVPTLDLLLRAYQATGVSVTSLEQNLVSLGPVFRGFGLDLAESTALTAAFEKEGVGTEAVMRGLRTALGQLSQAGIDADEALPDLLATLKEIPSAADAMNLAIQVFGARAGPALVDAVRSGRLEIADLLDDLVEGDDTIETVVEDTEDAAEKWDKAFKKMQVAAKPAGDAVFEMANIVAEKAIPVIEDFAKDLENIARLFNALNAGKINLGDIVGDAAGGLGRTAINASPLGALVGLTGNDLGQAVGDALASVGETLDNVGRDLAAQTPEAIIDPIVAALEDGADDVAAAAADVMDAAADGLDEGTDKASRRAKTAGGHFNQALIDALTGKNGGAGPAIEHEMERVAERAIDGFVAAMSANRANLQDRFGDFGVGVASALATALVDDTKSSGAAVFREVENIVLKLQKEGVPEWRELGDDLAGAFHDALLLGTQAAGDAALAKLEQTAAALKAHRALTPENLLGSLTEAVNAQALGGGAGILDSLTKALEEGGEDTRKTLAQQGAGWIAEVRRGLSPERADDVIAQFIAAMTDAVENDGPEARDALSELFRGVQVEIPTAAIDKALADAQEQIEQTRLDALAGAAESQRVAEDAKGRQDALKASQREALNALLLSQTGASATLPGGENAAAAEIQRLQDVAQRTLSRGREEIERSIALSRAEQDRQDARSNRPGIGIRVDDLAKLSQSERDAAIRRINDEQQARKAQDAAQDAQFKKQQDRAIEDLNRRRGYEDQDFAVKTANTAAIASLKDQQAIDTAALEAQLASESHQRQITQIEERATKDRQKAQEKHDADIQRLTDLQAGLDLARATADAMFDGALDDLQRIVDQSGTLADALTRVPRIGGSGVGPATGAVGATVNAGKTANVTLNVNAPINNVTPEDVAAAMTQQALNFIGSA